MDFSNRILFRGIVIFGLWIDLFAYSDLFLNPEFSGQNLGLHMSYFDQKVHFFVQKMLLK